MTCNISEVDKLLRMLKKHGVESFESGDLKLKISPVKYLEPLDDAKRTSKSRDKITDEDLFYSASTLKPRIK